MDLEVARYTLDCENAPSDNVAGQLLSPSKARPLQLTACREPLQSLQIAAPCAR